jgi:thymidine phosphorylase
MVGLGTAHGVRTSAVITDMDQPLGLAVGNALEVTESVEILRGGGPADVVEVTLALARRMVELAGGGLDPADVIADGSAMDRWNDMIRAQGGDPTAALARADEIETVGARSGGFITRIDARKVGEAAWRLGAGRARKEDPVSASAGVVLRAVAGDRVAAGDPVFDLHLDDPSRLAAALDALDGAVEIGTEPPAPRALVHEQIDA